MTGAAEQRLYGGGLEPKERATYGATVVWVNLDDGEVRTRALTGMTAMDALRTLVAGGDRWEGDWRIRVISTPVTIWRDCQGSRSFEPASEKYPGRLAEQRARVESLYLRKIGRLDLLEPGHGGPPASGAKAAA